MHCSRAWRRLAELVFVCVVASSVCAQRSNNAAKRPFTFEDMMTLKRVAEPVVSPDGRWVAYFMPERAKSALLSFETGAPRKYF